MGSQGFRVFAVISNDDETKGINISNTPGLRRMKIHVSAASAITFSRRWQAPPPLMQLRLRSTLNDIEEAQGLETYDGSEGSATHSSAPSIVTSIERYSSTSPNVSPAFTISCLDWNPTGRVSRYTGPEFARTHLLGRKHGLYWPPRLAGRSSPQHKVRSNLIHVQLGIVRYERIPSSYQNQFQ